MHSEKSHNTTHHGKMDVACQRISAKEPGEPAELHRLPDREPSAYGEAEAKDHRGVKQALHGIVVTRRCVSRKRRASERSRSTARGPVGRRSRQKCFDAIPYAI